MSVSRHRGTSECCGGDGPKLSLIRVEGQGVAVLYTHPDSVLFLSAPWDLWSVDVLGC